MWWLHWNRAVPADYRILAQRVVSVSDAVSVRLFTWWTLSALCGFVSQRMLGRETEGLRSDDFMDCSSDVEGLK